MATAKFTVDTHLFRELGELLVGRDSTALVELIKNSYDADATEVIVHGQNLADPERGQIVIRDNGLGMTQEQFKNGFLRIASRNKEEGARRSPRLSRRYTGEKGIGRLAAHKLAQVMQIDSVATDPLTGQPKERISATIDWRRIESAETLDNVPDDGVEVETRPLGKNPSPGTTITLSKLRRKWTEKERKNFVTEAQSTRPPNFLVEPLSSDVLAKPLLFDRLQVASSSAERGKRRGQQEQDTWALDLRGDFDIGDAHWQTLAQAASWVLEIDASKPGKVRYGVAPTAKGAREIPDAERFVSTHVPSEDGYPEFQARILIREGLATGREGSWVRSTYGVRVFMEGFRVLPYGEPGDDWLQIDYDYVRRSRALNPLAQDLFVADGSDPDVGLSRLSNTAYLGGVFLTHEGARTLRMLVNREGFVPDNALHQLQELLKIGIDLSVRVRAAAKQQQRQERREQRQEPREQRQESSEPRPERGQDTLANLETNVERGTKLLREARNYLALGNMEVASKKAIEAEEHLLPTKQQAKDIRDEQAMIRILASLGTQMAGYVHEINGLLGLARKVEAMVIELRDAWSAKGDSHKARQLARVVAAIADLRRALERQASYLTEIVTPDARRRRSAQRIADCFEKAWDLVAHAAETRSIELINNLPQELKSTPMFRAELVAVFSNLITNAIKAAGEGGRIHVSSKPSASGGTIIRLQNTGAAVEPAEGEKWFRPFASTTANVDITLGQGMGLGLPITRRILEEYGATITFAKPTGSYATAVQIVFPR